MKEIFGSNELFAGISIIAVGDLYQLPPIKKKPSYKIETYNLGHPWSIFKMIELSEIMRQKNDKGFTELLNRIRTASHTQGDIKVINSRCITQSDPNYPSDALHIWAENAPVDEHNQRKLKSIQAPLFTVKARDQYPKNVSKKDIDKVLARGRSETGGLDFEIQVKVGARIMLTSNIDIKDRLINGQMGTVLKIDVNLSQDPTIIYIKFDDEKAGRTIINTSCNSLARENRVVPIEPVLAKIKVRPGKASSPEIQRIQFPIALSWACSVHKVQGLTLENIVVSLEFRKQRSFNCGQIYVALRRATSLNGLYILGELQSKHIKANPKVHEEYERLRTPYACSKSSTEVECHNSSVLTVLLLNIRSLRKHSKDVKFHSQFFNCDVLAFTETQLLADVSDTEIIENLKPFRIYRQDHHTDKYMSMAICIKDTLTMEDYEYIPSLNIKFVLVDINLQKSRSFLLLYRKNNSIVSEYLQALRCVLQTTELTWYLGTLILITSMKLNLYHLLV